MSLLAIQLNIVPLSVHASTNPSTTTDDWPMFHHDPAHTGGTTALGPKTNPVEVWRYETYSPIILEPVVAGGNLYVTANTADTSGTVQKTLFCFNALTGKQIWNYSSRSYKAPAVYEGIVWTSGLAFNSSTGEALFGPLDYGGLFPTIADGVVYMYYDTVYAINASTGNQIWNHTVGEPRDAVSPAVAEGLLYVVGPYGRVYALNASTGEELWIYHTSAEVSSSPAIVNGCLYIGTSDSGIGYNNVYCLDALTGKQIWNFTAGSWVVSSPAVFGGYVYVGSRDDYLYALNASTGAKIWSYRTGGDVDSSPAVAGGVVYVGSFDGNLYAFDALTGDFLWKYEVGDGVGVSPAVANGYVYIASYYDGVVLALGESPLVTPSPSASQQPTQSPEPSATTIWSAEIILVLLLAVIAVSIAALSISKRHKRKI